MRCLVTALLLVLFAVPSWAGQPFGISLNPNGVSHIYPVLDSRDWLLTQPSPGKLYANPDPTRITHWADEYYAQDWARGCGQTFGLRLYAGISGKIIWAGPRGPYGNTVVIFDPETGFALKFSHLSEVAVSLGEWVLAGRSLVGRVGNTGNVQGGACASNPGAHLHLALFKNVKNPSAPPITTTYAGSGTGPTTFAAPFGYASQVRLLKDSRSPAVFAEYYGTKVPVTAASFESHGWWFDKHQSVFNPLVGSLVSTAQLNSIPQAYYFWPLRDNSLVKTDNSPTVYLFEDSRKYGLTHDSFMCRGLRFSEVALLSASDRDSYLPLEDRVSAQCMPSFKLALKDFSAYASQRGYQLPDLGSYQSDLDWERGWELRWMNFRSSSGQALGLYRCNDLATPANRYLGYFDPETGSWSGWQRIQ